MKLTLNDGLKLIGPVELITNGAFTPLPDIGPVIVLAFNVARPVVLVLIEVCCVAALAVHAAVTTASAAV